MTIGSNTTVANPSLLIIIDNREFCFPSTLKFSCQTPPKVWMDNSEFRILETIQITNRMEFMDVKNEITLLKRSTYF